MNIIKVALVKGDIAQLVHTDEGYVIKYREWATPCSVVDKANGYTGRVPRIILDDGMYGLDGDTVEAVITSLED